MEEILKLMLQENIEIIKATKSEDRCYKFSSEQIEEIVNDYHWHKTQQSKAIRVIRNLV
jgi:ABC-type lipopolysaccharide export system ATPase subunit